MEYSELIDSIRKEGSFNEENLKQLSIALDGIDFKSFKDPEFQAFAKLANDLPYHPHIQEFITRIVDRLSAKGVEPPCVGGCSEDNCALHTIESN